MNNNRISELGYAGLAALVYISSPVDHFLATYDSYLIRSIYISINNRTYICIYLTNKQNKTNSPANWGYFMYIIHGGTIIGIIRNVFACLRRSRSES